MDDTIRTNNSKVIAKLQRQNDALGDALKDMVWSFESLLNNIDSGDDFEAYLKAKELLRQQSTNGSNGDE